MKVSLQAGLSQQSTLTPQLQQAIRLLKLSTVDLEQEIQSAVDKNPLLELEKPEIGAEPTTENLLRDTATLPRLGPEVAGVSPSDTNNHPCQRINAANAPSNPLECMNAADDNLQTHLHWQLNVTKCAPIDRVIAFAIIDAIGSHGRLTTDLATIQAEINETQPHPVSAAQIRRVLTLIQEFDPVGVAAESLEDCLRIQLKQLPSETPHLDLAQKIVQQHILWLAQHNYTQLKKHYQVDNGELQGAINLIRTLNPTPGEAYSSVQADYISPDILVDRVNGRWEVSLNSARLPKVRLNQHYANLMPTRPQTTEHQFIKSHLQAAKWFIKSVQSRHDTLLKVATCIIRHQVDFLEKGEAVMKPLILSDIATDCALHESTISRVTTQKYVLTPRGVFELKYFFSSHVNRHDGGECSATAIQAAIKKIIQAENTLKPLSDSKIVLILEQKGVKIARRTVTKYRESLRIPASNLRKRV